MLLPKGHKGRPGIPLQNPTSITIHWIGPYPNQNDAIVYNWWDTGNVTASAHFIVKDDKCTQIIPTDEVAWHCGSRGNYTSIGIEVVPENTDGKFSDKTIETLHDLCQTLPDVELVRHYDWTKKTCPLYYTPMTEGGQERWEELKVRIRHG